MHETTKFDPTNSPIIIIEVLEFKFSMNSVKFGFSFIFLANVIGLIRAKNKSNQYAVGSIILYNEICRFALMWLGRLYFSFLHSQRI